jgi:hypothetical protein
MSVYRQTGARAESIAAYMCVIGALFSAAVFIRGLGVLGGPVSAVRLAAGGGFTVMFVGLTLWRGTQRVDFALGAFATAIALIAGFEAYTWYRVRTLAQHAPPLAAVLQDAGLAAQVAAGDWRPRDQIERELEAKGAKLNRSGGLFNLLPWADLGYTNGLMPLSGAANRTWVYCNEGGFWPVVRTDRHGFSNDDAVWDRPDRRVLLVGDSFAAGACVNQEDTVAGQLRRMGYAAASLGTGGNGPLLELATLREYGRLFRPRVVVWFCFDFHMIHRLTVDKLDSGWGGEAYSAALLRYLDPGYSQNLAARQGEIDAFWDWLWANHNTLRQRQESDPGAAAKRRAALNTVRASLGYQPLPPDRQLSFDEGTALLVDVLSRAKAEVESWGGTLVFAVYYDISHFRAGPSPHRAKFLPPIAALGIPIVDVDAAIAATGDPMAHFPFRGHPTPFNSAGWGHYNAQGYGVFAEALAKAMGDLR